MERIKQVAITECGRPQTGKRYCADCRMGTFVTGMCKWCNKKYHKWYRGTQQGGKHHRAASKRYSNKPHAKLKRSLRDRRKAFIWGYWRTGGCTHEGLQEALKIYDKDMEFLNAPSAQKT